MEFKSLRCFRMLKDCEVTERRQGLELQLKSDPQRLREKKNIAIMSTAMYLSKLGSDGIKLGLLVHCSGNIISLKWL